MEVAIVFICLFIIVFGIFYLYFTTRNKERLALIEKGKDTSIFMKQKGERNGTGIGKVIILNLALLFIGVGAGILAGNVLHNHFGMNDEAAYPALIFLFSGIFLLVGFYLTKQMEKERK